MNLLHLEWSGGATVSSAVRHFSVLDDSLSSIINLY